ncbi:T9SS type A sorting domain-containing protein [Polaribacter aestuariivivens]|uniref:T9SS type A sorting domain-containing protein n=1 Tax=Polaribacter aestuariivivens TaxID=2304626 RepID=UPI003F49505A
MKKITFLLFACFTISIIGQDKLTSNVNQYYDGVNWVNNSRSTYIYDANNNLTEEAYFSWNSINASWDLNARETYTYNSQNKIITDTYEDLDSSGNPEDGFRTNYTYNSNNQIIESIDQEKINNVWVNEHRNTFTYTNNKITGLLSEEWNGSSWVLVTEGSQRDASSRVVIKYGSNNLVSEYTYEEWNGSSWDLDGRDTYSYNSSNKAIENISQDWNGTSYVNNYKAEYTYDGNGNLILEKDFDFENGTFTNSYEESYTFDTSKLMSTIINPFKDKTGFAALTGEDQQFVNKITGSSTGNNDRTIYYYNGATASVEDFTALNFKAYPNPTNGIFTIDTANFEVERIDLFNILGKKVFSTNQKQVDITSLSQGFYLLKVQTKEGKVASKRIIKN